MRFLTGMTARAAVSAAFVVAAVATVVFLAAAPACASQTPAKLGEDLLADGEIGRHFMAHL